MNNSINGDNFFITRTKKIESPKNVKNNQYYSVKGNSRQDIFSYNQTDEIKALNEEFNKVKNQQGLIGKAWDGFKNIFGMKSGSKHIEKVISQVQSGKISTEEAKEAIKKYEEGQKTSVDVVADIASGILAVGAFALAVPTGGASLAVGLGAAAAVGAGVKIGIKGIDAKATGKEYTGKDLLYDTVTGGINGVLAPVTNGIGNCVTKTISKKIIQESAEAAVKQGAKQAIKSAIINQSVDVVGGTLGQRALAIGAGMAVDGALSGAADNMVRAGFEGENILHAGVQGAVGGLIMAPIIGGGFNVMGHAGRALNNKFTMFKVLPDGINTKFKQGNIGDCAFLSTLDGLMNNPATAKNIKRAITKTAGGDYNVKIGGQIVKVAKSSLTDEMLSDTTGIRIFEQAYKQISGSLDGGFADVVAKEFGLNPIHITNEHITDEILEKIAKEQNNTILSFGAFVDETGALSNQGGQQHYFTIKNIDADAKTISLTSPIDTSETIKMSFDEAKQLGISIDGGSIKPTDLPNAIRTDGDIKFKGIDTPQKPLSLDETIKHYHQEKLNHAKKHSIIDGQEILANWEKELAIPDSQGKFIRAVEKLSKDNGALDKFLDSAFPNLDKTTRENAKKLLKEYLEENLDIYSYDRMKNILSGFNHQIKDIENPIFYIPRQGKSYDIVASLYSQINPEASFILGPNNLQAYLSKNLNSNVIILDDCIASGSSAINVYNAIKDFDGINSVTMFSFLMSKDGLERIQQEAPNLKLYFDGEVKAPLKETDFYKNLQIENNGKIIHVKQDFLLKLLEGGVSSNNQYNLNNFAILFEHMAPNNNSIFASNMLTDLYSGPKVAIKNSSRIIGNKNIQLVFPPSWLQRITNAAV